MLRNQVQWVIWAIALCQAIPSGAVLARARPSGTNFRVAYTAKDYLKTQGHDVDKQMVCKEPFYPSGRTCYLVSPEKMKFEDADKFCSSAGASFVEPSTSEKMNEVKNFLKSRDEQVDVWVGGQKKSGHWIWTTSGAHLQTTFWAPNEPAGTWKLWAPKDFVKLSYQSDYQWKAESNGKELNVLCEQHDPLLAAACPDGTIFRGQCYTIGHEKKTWQNARAHCEKTKGEIVMVDKKPVYQFLETKLYQLFGEPISNTIWTFEYKVSSGFWINIWKAVTRLFGAGEECSLFDRDTGEVSIVDCGTKHPYVCVFENREKFPVNCIEHDGKCYNVYTEPKPARDAQLACQGIGAQRLKIEDESQETTILIDLFQEGNGTPERGLWLDSHVEGGQSRKLGLSAFFDRLFYLHMERGSGLAAECNVLNHDRGSIDSRDCQERHFFACEYGVQDDQYAVEKLNQEVEELERQLKESSGAFLHKVQEVNQREGDKDLFQVDIRLTPEQELRLHGNVVTSNGNGLNQLDADVTPELYRDWLSHQHRRTRRNALSNTVGTWPSGKVPYVIDPRSYDAHEMALLKSAFSDITEQTCVQFVPRTTEEDYIYINNTQQGCYSYVGRIGGQQVLSLSTRCIDQSSIGTIQHELLHALGFYHEQSRYDRDDWIEINMENIREEHRINFEKIPQEMMEVNGLPYDYNSLMHYPLNAFAIDESVPTIITRRETKATIGQRRGPSTNDYLEINRLYNCQLPVNGGWGFWASWTPCSATCGGGQRSRSRDCDRPSPSNGGAACQGSSVETETCMPEECPSLLQGHVHLGCWMDPTLPTLLETLEGQSSYLTGQYSERRDSVKQCAQAAREKGYTIFALRFGGKCFVQLETDDAALYKSLGPSDKCEHGKGSLGAIDVYRLGSGQVDGDYGPWSVFAPCTKSCGGGIREFTRSCTNPEPSLLGKPCEGPAKKTEACNLMECPVDGGWSVWGNWSLCSSPCGTDGFSTRRRFCDNPTPMHGGQDCGDSLYDGVEIRECNRIPCSSGNPAQSQQKTPAMDFSMEQLHGLKIEGNTGPLIIQGEVNLTEDGRVGHGLKLQGGQVTYQGQSCLNIPSQCEMGFTLSMFLKADIAHVKERDRPTYVFSSGVQSEEVETDDHQGLALYFRQDGMLKATLRTNEVECTTDLPPSLFTDSARFYHVAVIYSTEVCLTMYYQGEPLDNDVHGRPNENKGSRTRDSFILGKSFDVTGHELRGTLDEVQFWTESLSAADVQQVFRSVPLSCSDCDPNADCSVQGCTCKPGYQGDGFTCGKEKAAADSSTDSAAIYLPLDEGQDPELQATTGMIGSAISFDGRRDWINAGNFSGKCLSKPDNCEDGFTIAYWMKYFGRGDRPNYVLSSAAQGRATGVDVYIDGDKMNVSVLTTTRHFTAILPISTNQWVQYSIVWNQTGGLKVFVNGQLMEDVTQPKPVTLSETENTELRIAQPNNCFVLNGRFILDDVTVWLESLDASEPEHQ
ncbi:uncharacterized protein LOC135475322 isoform X2 [Liolophura sinensis]|uniref:uncharacterized protein LOC135475322 isoform X2 n=1 Tax=Liolophura sinensis TaxID=3198878 RepID=UPI003158F00D